MGKAYAIYLGIVAAALATMAAWAFGTTFADITAFADGITAMLVAIVTDNFFLYSLFASVVIIGTAFYSWITFGYLFAGKKSKNVLAAFVGFFGGTVVAMILMLQGIQAQVHQDQQQMAQWYTDLTLFGVIMAFFGLAAIGRWIFAKAKAAGE
mgnify:CR=1 FL=1